MAFAKAAAEPDPEKRPFSIAFTCVVYIVVDNTMHLRAALWLVTR